MAKSKSDEAINFDSVIKNLSSDSKVSDTPWFKKKASIIAMSSTLGVGALATIIAVPIALTSGSTSSEAPPTTIDQAAAIAAFNTKKSTSQKIDLYNSIMANSSNHTAIKNYITQGNSGGMSKFINANVTTPTSATTLKLFNDFKGVLNTNLFNNVNVSNFLNIKGIASTTNNITNNNNDSSRYFQHPITLGSDGVLFSFFSPIKTSITNVTMKNDFSIEMTLPNDQSNIAFIIKDGLATDHLIYYNQKITFSNLTLFPGMSEFVGKNIFNWIA